MMVTINDFSMQYPAGISDALLESIDKGWYEAKEAKLLQKHLRPGDNVLDLGGGIGFIAIAAKKLGAYEVTTVEASPSLCNIIQSNAKNNDVKLTVRNAFATAYAAESTAFYEDPDFWASNGLNKASTTMKTIEVESLSFQSLIKVHRPNLIMMDIEGAEYDIFEWLQNEETYGLLDAVHTMIIELHPKHRRGTGWRICEDAVKAHGFRLKFEGNMAIATKP